MALSRAKCGLFCFLLWTRLTTALTGQRGTFSNPAAASRPFFRYWLPDASVDPDLVARDIENAGRIGAGGVEFLPFYNYGGEMGGYPAGADWAKYGFGSPAFNAIFRRALETHRDNDMVMDFAIGPNQGQGVPADVEDEGLQWDLAPFAQSVQTEKTQASSIKLQGWEEGKLIAAVTALVTSVESIKTEPAHVQLTLQEGSLEIVTSNVSSKGYLSMTEELQIDSIERWVFAFYQRRTRARNVVFPTKSTDSIFANGSFTVDHFSSRGAQTVINFWEKHILRNGVDKLLYEAGNYGWEDSLEIQSNISWTSQLPTRFRSQHGYDLLPYLPLIIWGNNNLNIQKNNPGKFRVLLGSDDDGSGHINAYRATLQECYKEYLGALSKWTNFRLGRPMSVQVSYNMPMDVAATVPFVDVPECESLQWADNIDGYRQFSGPAALAGQRVVSNEMGAKFLSAFKHTIPDLLLSINRAIAGGVNRMVLHGQTYAHSYYNTTWPGYTAWQYVVSEPYSDKHPSWNNGLGEALEYVARIQHIMQTGRSLIDIAVYNRVSASDYKFRSFRNSSDLLNAGYSYAYVSPDNFDLPTTKVRDRQLGPDSASFRALVITSEHNEITLNGAKHLVSFAKAGLSIIIEGEPRHYAMGNGSSDAVSRVFKKLSSLPSVYHCAKGELTTTLGRVGIMPRTGTKFNSTVHTVWRNDDQNGINYLFLFNDLAISSGYIEVALRAFPYIFDAWSGQITPLLRYSTRQDGQVIRIPIHLAPGQTVLFGFSKQPLRDVDTPSFSIDEMPLSVLGHEYSRRGGLYLHVSHQARSGSSSRLILSTGYKQSLKISHRVRPPYELKHWTLHAEHWEAPRNMSDANIVALKRNTTHNFEGTLPGWTKDPELATVSGIGYYETVFEWSDDRKRYGAYLSLDRVLHAAQVLVNGRKTYPVNCNNPIIDIGPHLRAGKNEVVVIVPTTMWNYIRSLGDRVLSSGAPPLHVYGIHGPVRVLPPPEPSENGLVGRVVLTPYERVRVKI